MKRKRNEGLVAELLILMSILTSEVKKGGPLHGRPHCRTGFCVPPE
jgi:hypothetical protein